jgi:hypothetical protein
MIARLERVGEVRPASEPNKPAQSAEDFSSAVSPAISTAIPVIEMPRRPRRRDVQDLPVVPDRPGQQVLQPVRPAMPERLGGGPAVVIVQFHQQAAHHLAAALPGFPPGKAPGDLSQQVRQQRGPGIIGYRGSSDCHVLIVSHKPIMIVAAAPLRGSLICANNLAITNYRCRK